MTFEEALKLWPMAKNQKYKEFRMFPDGSRALVIPVTGSDGALIDVEDFAKVSGYKWRKSTYGYATADTRIEDGTRTTLLMHRLVMGAQKGQVVDHANHNELDNRKCNLRICTKAENGRNRRGTNRNNASGHLGVSWDKKNQKWKAQLQGNGKHIHLGLFDILEDAIEARRVGELKYFGSFAGPSNRQPNERLSHTPKAA